MKARYLVFVRLARRMAAVFFATLMLNMAAGQGTGRVYRVAIDREYEPYEFVDEQGHAQGVTPALLRVIGTAAGVRFEFVPLTWPAAVEALNNGGVDLVSMIQTPERMADYEFSTPHSRITQAIFRRHGADDVVGLASLAGHTVGLQQDDIALLKLAGRADFKLHIVKSKLDGMMHLSNGEVDAFLCAQQAGVRLVSSYNFTNIDLAAGELFPQNFAFATRRGNHPLIKLLDQHLARMRDSGQLNVLSEEWLAGRLAAPGWLEKNRTALLVLGGMLIGALVLVLVWNRSLRRKVLARTKSLGESEARYRLLFDGMTDAVFMHGITDDDLPELFLAVNDVACRQLGYTREELLRLSPRDIDAPESKVDLRSLAQKLKCGESVLFEQIHVIKDGRRMPVEIHAQSFLLQNRRVVLSVVRDITGRRQAEEKMARLNRRLELILCSSAEGIIGLDTQGNHTFINPAAAKMLGYEPEDLLGRHSHSTWHHSKSDGSHQPEKDCAIAASYRDGALQRVFSEVFWRKDGTSFPVEYASRPIYEQGRLAGAVVNFMDITERKRAEEELRQSERRFHNLFQQIPSVAIQGYAPDGTTRYWNEASEQLYGYTAQEAIGKSLLELIIPPEMRDGVTQAIRQMAETGQAIPSGELSLMRKDGSRVAVFSSHAVMQMPGHPPELFCIDIDLTARKQAETALRESEARSRALVENVPQRIFMKSRDLKFVSANSHFAADIGIRPEEILGKTDHDFFPEKLAEKYQADDERVMQAGQTEEYEEKFVRDSGEIWVHTVKTPVRDAHGKVIGVVGIFSDTTERRRAEERMREANERLTALIEAIPASIFFKDGQGRWLVTNSAAKMLFKIQDCDWFGKTDEQLGAARPEFKAAHDACVISDETAWNNRRLTFSEEFLQDEQDHTRHYAVTKVPLFDAAGNRQALVIIGSDITERKRAERVLRLQGAALEAAANAIVITDPDGRIEWVNAAFTTNTGYTAAEAIGKKPRILKSGKHDEAFYKNMWDTIRAGEVWQNEIINRRKDGSFCHEEMTITPLRDESGKISHFIAVKQDITQRKLLEEEFRQSQKMEAFGQLAGGVAHDFNNILTVIQGNAMLMQMALPVAEKQPALEQIIHASERAAGLTRQLLAFGRRQLMRVRVTDLNEVVTDTGKMLQRLIGEHITLKIQLLPGGAPVEADPGMVEQVLLNLVVNARDAMPAGGQIGIRLESVTFSGDDAGHPKARAGRFVRLSVRDNGGGMPPEVLSRIFEPFFTTKDVGKGTGLGLAIVHGIMAQHHGWVEAESREKEGTEFHLYLPWMTSENTPLLAGQEIVCRGRGGSETILLVEDEPAVRVLAVKVLKEHGYQVLEAGSGGEALEQWPQVRDRVDLLLTDLIMPGDVSGAKLAVRLRADKPGLKLLYMSGYPGEVVGRGLDLREGVNFLQKPFMPSQIAQIVRDCLDAPQK